MISTAMVQLLPPRNRDARNVYASKSLPFVESGSGKYTHRIRTLSLVTMHSPRHQPHSAASCWCGMTILLSPKHCHARSRIVAEPSRVLCATCEGRAIGAGQLGAAEIAGRPMMFSPRMGQSA